MNETPPQTDPATEAELRAMFASMMEEGDLRETRFAAMVEAQREATGPCPACRAPGQYLDGGETLEESVRRNEWSPAYEVCEGCVEEGAERERLARWGVPARVRHASFANYETMGDPRRVEAVEAVRAWIRDPEAVFLCLLGGCGTGKGHLASAALREMGVRARWTTHASMIDDYHATALEWRPAMLAKYKSVPVLVLDEMGGRSMTVDTPEVFYRILDERYDRELRTILIGNIPLRSSDERKPSILGIAGDDRFASRLAETGTVVRFRWEDYRRRKGGAEA